MDAVKEAQYIGRFLDTYDRYTDQEKGEREAACLEVQHTYGILEPEEQDVLCGRYRIPCVGFSMQDCGMGYYIDEEQYRILLEQIPEEWKEKLTDRVEKWRSETGREQLIQKTPEDVLRLLPNDHFDKESNVGFWLCRMSSTQLDFDKLLKKGIVGLKEEITGHLEECSGEQQKTLYTDMLHALEALERIIQFHRKRIMSMEHPSKEKLSKVLEAITQRKPETFYEAVQLMYFYAIVSGTYNYGRMDEYLGDFLAEDMAAGRLARDEAKEILICLWKLMIQRKTTWNGRVIIGGLGRRNEKNADLCAELILEVAFEVKDVLPQLSLRFHKNQNKKLMDYALEGIGKGSVYPILYNDDVNVPAVQKAFGVSYQEAVSYLPFGCGEYVLYHRSVGTPSDVINLLKALEITIFNGFDHVSGKQIGLKTGEFENFRSFEEFFQAYCRQTERFVDAEARQQREEYRVAQEHSPFLLASILYDDCLKRGKAIYDGGACYMGGTLETYGNINTADSLTAIKKLVFDRKRISGQELKEMLLKDFQGYEKQRGLLCDAPKYGNDDPEADEMAKRVHEHICLYTGSRAEKVGLDTYLVVVINNSANTSMGKFTLASADGRHAYEPLANANNPSGGSDKNGLTAFFNSLVKLSPQIHAGSVQNVKFSKEMFTTYFEKTKAMLQVYFEMGGAQLMINVLGREDLENALLNPEKYRNLIVRVGGFCARFVELEPAVQKEIMSRTMY